MRPPLHFGFQPPPPFCSSSLHRSGTVAAVPASRSRIEIERPRSYKDNADGHFPQYGAIFMANTSTRKECFVRRIFGLPSTFASFVMNIKAGMILFLFDYQERKLYGVFGACSDGTMNIVSHAYESSGKQFPAQVQFQIIWRCHPIPEIVFRGAIEENYYAPYKFHFGLSKNQVWKLLLLFEKRMAKCFQPLSTAEVPRGECESSMEVGSPNLPHAPTSPSHELPIVHPGQPANSDPQVLVAPDGISLVAKDYPETVIEKSPVSDVSQDKYASEPEDFIPLPPLEPEEIEDILPDGPIEEWGLDLFADCGLGAGTLQGIFDSGPISLPFENGEHLEEGEILEEGECSLKCDNNPLDSPISEEQAEHDSQTHPTSEYPVKGLNCDNQESRTSVFSRLEASTGVTSGNFQRMNSAVSGREETSGSNLSGNVNTKASVSSRLNFRSRTAFQKGQRATHVGKAIQIMKILEQQHHKRWESERKKRKYGNTVQYDSFRTGGKRTSVFSRLNFNYASQVKGTQKASASLMKNQSSLPHEYGHGQALSHAGNDERCDNGEGRIVALETEKAVKSMGEIKTGTEELQLEGQQKRRKIFLLSS